MEQIQEKLLEIHREFSTITAEDLLECGIKNFARHIGYDMTSDGVNIIESKSKKVQLLFTVCDGEFVIRYGTDENILVKDAINLIAYDGRKFYKCWK